MTPPPAGELDVCFVGVCSVELIVVGHSLKRSGLNILNRIYSKCTRCKDSVVWPYKYSKSSD
jgi:hypothetical protein